MGDGFVGRYEVLDDRGGRRTWPVETKLRIVAESHVPGAMVGDVARRYRLMPSQLTTWRRLHRDGLLGSPSASAEPPRPAFVPLMLDSASEADPGVADPDDRIEIEAGGVVVRLPGSAPAARLAEIVTALRRGPE